MSTPTITRFVAVDNSRWFIEHRGEIVADFDYGDVVSDLKHYEDVFRYSHLADSLQKISKPCGELAEQMVSEIANLNGRSDRELEVGLRKLLEAKDAFVRALAVSKGEGPVTK
jgi:hypothetical protein